MLIVYVKGFMFSGHGLGWSRELDILFYLQKFVEKFRALSLNYRSPLCSDC